MKTAISIPDQVFELAEKMAKRLSMSRSQLYTKAIEAFIQSQRDDQVTEILNKVYAEQESELDSRLQDMQTASIISGAGSDEW
jgi:metal-responsive CopG/Arc/MetJ family transcriptional regulator